MTLGRLILVVACLPATGIAPVIRAAPIVSPVEAVAPGVDSGELLLAELNCVACHHVDAAIRTRLAARPSPVLGDAGLLLTPQFLREFLANPHAEKPGTTMPDVLHALEPAPKRDTVEALTHFLVSLNKAAPSAPIGAEQFKIQQGRLLFHSVGCVACHAPQEPAAAIQAKRSSGEEAAPTKSSASDWERLQQTSIPLGNLARKTTVEQLARFLLDPLQVRPSGRMPSLNLSQPEAVAIAMYLLREQASSLANPSAPAQKIEGLAYYYLEKSDGSNSPADSIAASNSGLLERFPGPRRMIQGATLRVASSGIVDRFSVTPRKRLNEIAFTFTGNLSIPAAGRYTFYTASDDGSRLYLGDRLVVKNDGEHALEERKGSIDLPVGEHPIMVTYFNNGGGAELQVSYEGPGLAKREIPAAALSHLSQPMIPLGEEKFVVEAEKTTRGRELFGSLGCAACHQLGSVASESSLQAKPLANLNPRQTDGCLGGQVKSGLPQYQLSDAQRRSIQATLAEHAKLAQPLAAHAQINRTLAALNCLACHTRDGLGGPAASRAEYFTVVGDADLGDEGRLPPHLTRVGDKLRPEWLREVLFNKGTVRPYMATRMPQFGRENVAALADAFVKAESSKTDGPPSEYDARDAKFGRKLVGREGLTCITCHTFAKHKSLGVPAMDMTQMSKRLKKDWFRRYLLNPSSLRPGTRMPSFWPDGQAANKEILDGDTERQIDAIWTFLSPLLISQRSDRGLSGRGRRRIGSGAGASCDFEVSPARVKTVVPRGGRIEDRRETKRQLPGGRESDVEV